MCSSADSFLLSAFFIDFFLYVASCYKKEEVTGMTTRFLELPCYKYIIRSIDFMNHDELLIFSKNFFENVRKNNIPPSIYKTAFLTFPQTIITTKVPNLMNYRGTSLPIDTLIETVCNDDSIPVFSCKEYYAKIDNTCSCCSCCPISDNFCNANWDNEIKILTFAISFQKNFKYLSDRISGHEHSIFSSVSDANEHTSSPYPIVFHANYFIYRVLCENIDAVFKNNDIPYGNLTRSMVKLLKKEQIFQERKLNSDSVRSMIINNMSGIKKGDASVNLADVDKYINSILDSETSSTVETESSTECNTTELFPDVELPEGYEQYNNTSYYEEDEPESIPVSEPIAINIDENGQVCVDIDYKELELSPCEHSVFEGIEPSITDSMNDDLEEENDLDLLEEQIESAKKESQINTSTEPSLDIPLLPTDKESDKIPEESFKEGPEIDNEEELAESDDMEVPTEENTVCQLEAPDETADDSIIGDPADESEYLPNEAALKPEELAKLFEETPEPEDISHDDFAVSDTQTEEPLEHKAEEKTTELQEQTSASETDVNTFTEDKKEYFRTLPRTFTPSDMCHVFDTYVPREYMEQHAKPLYNNPAILSDFENNVYRDGRLYVETIYDEKNKSAMLFYNFTTRTYYYSYLEHPMELDILSSFLSKHSFAVVTYQPYRLYSFCNSHGISVHGVLSIYTAYHVFKDRANYETYHEIIGAMCKRKIYLTGEFYEKIFDGMTLYPSFYRIYQHTYVTDKVYKNQLLKYEEQSQWDEIYGYSYLLSEYFKTNKVLFILTKYGEFSFNEDKFKSEMDGYFLSYTLNTDNQETSAFIIKELLHHLLMKGYLEKLDIILTSVQQISFTLFVNKELKDDIQTIISDCFLDLGVNRNLITYAINLEIIDFNME